MVGQRGETDAKTTSKLSAAVVVDGATRARALVRFFSTMFLGSTDAVVLEALLQLEESCTDGEFNGVSVRRLSDAVQLSERVVDGSLDGLVKNQMVVVYRPPVADRPTKRRKPKKSTNLPDTSSSLASGKQLAAFNGYEEEGGDDSDDVTEPSSSSSEEEQDAEEVALKYAIDFRKTVRLAGWYYQSCFAKLCAVSKEERQGFADILSNGQVFAPTEARGAKKSSHSDVVEPELLCDRCTCFHAVERVSPLCRCPHCGADLIQRTLLRASEFLVQRHRAKKGGLTMRKRTREAEIGQKGDTKEVKDEKQTQRRDDGVDDDTVPLQVSDVKPALPLPRKLLEDVALLSQGLTFAGLLQEQFVALHEAPTAITRAEDMMTRSEMRQVAEQSSTSSLTLKYRSVSFIPVQILSLERKEELSAIRIRNKLKRQLHQPPWLLQNSNITLDPSLLQSEPSSVAVGAVPDVWSDASKPVGLHLLESGRTKTNDDDDEEWESVPLR